MPRPFVSAGFCGYQGGALVPPGRVVDLLKLLESIKALDIFAPNQQLQRGDIVALRVYPFVSGCVAIKSTFVSDLSVSINVANSEHFSFPPVVLFPSFFNLFSLSDISIY